MDRGPPSGRLGLTVAFGEALTPVLVRSPGPCIRRRAVSTALMLASRRKLR